MKRVTFGAFDPELRTKIIELVWTPENFSTPHKKQLIRQIYAHPLLLRYYRFQRHLKKKTREILLETPPPPPDLDAYILDRVFGQK